MIASTANDKRKNEKNRGKKSERNRRICRHEKKTTTIEMIEQYLALSHGVNQTFDHKNKVFIIFDKIPY